MSSKPTDTETSEINGVIYVECKTLKHVVSSAAKAEVGGIIHNSQVVIRIQTILYALNHPQPPTPLKIDNIIVKVLHTTTYTTSGSRENSTLLIFLVLDNP